MKTKAETKKETKKDEPKYTIAQLRNAFMDGGKQGANAMRGRDFLTFEEWIKEFQK